MAEQSYINRRGELNVQPKDDYIRRSRVAKKFVLWLIVVTSSIMFAGWTSYYIVFAGSKGKGHGLVLPDMFIYSTLVLIISSITLYLAQRNFKTGNIKSEKTMLLITVLLGVVFSALQFMGWRQLTLAGSTFINNNAGISMIYVFTLFHVFHVIAGICLLLNAYRGAAVQKDNETMEYQISIASIFWHFLDILWIYLYVFLLLNR